MDIFILHMIHNAPSSAEIHPGLWELVLIWLHSQSRWICFMDGTVRGSNYRLVLFFTHLHGMLTWLMVEAVVCDNCPT